VQTTSAKPSRSVRAASVTNHSPVLNKEDNATPPKKKSKDGIEDKPNGTYLARVCVNGQRRSQIFSTRREAKQWRILITSELRSAGQPKGLDPDKTTLAQALVMLAETESKFKKGAVQEINRINRWLDACALPRLKRTPNGGGGWDIETTET